MGQDSQPWRFPNETVAFLRDLKRNNQRDWFKEHKKRFEAAVKYPAEDFVDLLEAEFEQLTNRAHASKIFRIHRDVRFSKDKTPYNSHLHISLFPDEVDYQGPHWFFGLDTEKLILGVGIFGFDKAALTRYRQRIHGEAGAALDEILRALIAKGAYLHEPELKRVPRDYDPEHPRAELLRRKGLAVWQDLGPAAVATKGDLVAHCMAQFESLKPVADWLEAS